MIHRVLMARGSDHPHHPFQSGRLPEGNHGQPVGLATGNSRVMNLDPQFHSYRQGQPAPPEPNLSGFRIPSAGRRYFAPEIVSAQTSLL